MLPHCPSTCCSSGSFRGTVSPTMRICPHCNNVAPTHPPLWKQAGMHSNHDGVLIRSQRRGKPALRRTHQQLPCGGSLLSKQETLLPPRGTAFRQMTPGRPRRRHLCPHGLRETPRIAGGTHIDAAIGVRQPTSTGVCVRPRLNTVRYGTHVRRDTRTNTRSRLHAESTAALGR